VRKIIAARLGNTALLAASSFAVAAILGIALGAIAASSSSRARARARRSTSTTISTSTTTTSTSPSTSSRRIRHDSLIGAAAETFALLGVAVPRFFLAPMLVLVFSLGLHWFPPAGADEGARSLVLPALSLGTALAALLARMTRVTLDDVLASDHVRTARAKGLGEAAVLAKHALPAALPPVVTVMGLQVGGLLAGAVVTEKIFAWPGIGLLLLESIQKLDVPVVQGVVLVTALFTALATLTADAVVRVLDPRLRRR
jgi:peptide/nickel transport system permease protein